MPPEGVPPGPEVPAPAPPLLPGFEVPGVDPPDVGVVLPVLVGELLDPPPQAISTLSIAERKTAATGLRGEQFIDVPCSKRLVLIWVAEAWPGVVPEPAELQKRRMHQAAGCLIAGLRSSIFNSVCSTSFSTFLAFSRSTLRSTRMLA